MNLLPPPTPFGHTIFCDDIRQEVGGKISFMGTYRSYIYFPSFPMDIPKFCLFVTYHEAAEGDIPPLELQVYFPDDEEGMPSFIQPHGFPALSGTPPPALVGLTPLRTMIIPVVFAPFHVEHAGPIRVRMKRGDDLVRLGALYADLPPNQDTPPAT